MKDYFKQRDENNLQRLRGIIRELPDFAREFFIGVQNTTSVLTRLNYAYDMRIFFDFLLVNNFRKSDIRDIELSDLASLRGFDIELYLDHLTNYDFGGNNYSCGECGKQRKLASLRSFLNYYFRKDRLETNVALKVSMPKIHEKPIIRLEPNEIARLLDEIESASVSGVSAHQDRYLQNTKLRDLAIVTLFLGTGIRISELVGLNKSDIDFSSNSFRVTRKGGGQSILYFNDEIAAPVQEYINAVKSEIESITKFGKKIIDSGDVDALFFSLQGKRISTRAVQDLVKKFSRLVTPLKRITPHKLRSTFGTELYRNTQDIYVVADVLGHKDINTTKKHYADISDEIRRHAAQTVALRSDPQSSAACPKSTPSHIPENPSAGSDTDKN